VESERQRVLLTLAVEAPALEAAYDVVRGSVGDAPDAVALLCAPTEVVTAADVASMPGLRVVSVAGAGTDGIDHEALRAAEVELLTVPETTASATADLAMTLMLMAARRVDDAQSDLRRGQWPGWSFADAPGRDVHGATLGLVGFGHIGRALAARARAFSMTVLHHTRTPTGEPGHKARLADLLPSSDFLSIHVPLTEQTRGLIGAAELDLLPEGAVVVNTARGGIVDEDALCDRLASGRLFAAALDVFDGEPTVSPRLLAAPHLVLTPHIGSATRQTRAGMVATAEARLLEALSGVPGAVPGR
jgi:phosphoglycerate dehydrogenase-like enzyme